MSELKPSRRLLGGFSPKSSFSFICVAAGLEGGEGPPDCHLHTGRTHSRRSARICGMNEPGEGRAVAGSVRTLLTDARSICVLGPLTNNPESGWKADSESEG